MKITKENLKRLNVEDVKLLSSLLDTIDEINLMFPIASFYIEYQDWHGDYPEYSIERTDPCPDYFGYYRLRVSNTDEMIGTEMTINQLDDAICILWDIVDLFYNE